MLNAADWLQFRFVSSRLSSDRNNSLISLAVMTTSSPLTCVDGMRGEKRKGEERPNRNPNITIWQWQAEGFFTSEASHDSCMHMSQDSTHTEHQQSA